MNARGACPSCGNDLAPEDAFCANCGAGVQDKDRTALASRRRRMSESSLVDGKCRSCNGPLRSTDVFCPECGARRAPTTGAASVHQSDSFQRLRQRLEEKAGHEFEVLEELGRGGMGAVYLARERALDRPVAIKVLFPKFLADESMLERFRNEARIVAALRHPSIVGLHAVRNLEDLHFFVMDYIEGASLEKLVRTHGPLPVPVIKAVLYQVGSALAYAHRQGKGVIHRDIKPSNVMLDSEGSAVVMDFGISKAVNRSQGLTMTGAIIGTPEYMSPEQCRGDSLTTASDQYSLGLVGYTMLTGGPPFCGPHYAVLLAHLTEEPPPIREIRSDCPEELEVAVLRMLSKTPDERFDDIRAAIKAFGGRPVEHGDPVRMQIADLVRDAGGVSRKATVVAEVSISHPPRRVVPGDRFILEAIPMDELGKELDDRDVVWASTDPGVIHVTAEGTFEALAEGRAWIKAKCEGREAAVEVVVTRAPVAGVRVTEPPARIRPGDRVRLEATPVDEAGAPLAGREVKWSSSDAAVAFVTSGGSVEAVGPGPTVITAECEGVRTTVELRVQKAAVARIWLSAAPAVLHPGDEFTLDVAVLDRKGVRLEDRAVSWEARPPGVVEALGEGRFRALGDGDAEIVARCEGREATTTVGVLPEPGSTLAPPGPRGASGWQPPEPAGWEPEPPEATVLAPKLPEPRGPKGGRARIPSSATAPTPPPEDVRTVTAPERPPSRSRKALPWIGLGGLAVVALVVGLVWSGGEGRGPVSGSQAPAAGGVPEPAGQAGPGGRRGAAVEGAAASGGTEPEEAGAAAENPATGVPAVLELAPPEASVVAGDSIRLSALARDADGRSVEAAGVSWSMAGGSPRGVARVGSDGTVVGLAPGTVSVEARLAGLSRRARVVVTAAPAERPSAPTEETGEVPRPRAPVLVGLTVQGGGGPLATGEERTYRVAGRGSDGNPLPIPGDEVRWRSTRTDVVEVQYGGRARGMADGSAWLVATARGFSDSVRVEVVTRVASVTIGSVPSRIAQGQTASLDATVRDGDGATLRRAVAWRSSSPGILSVDPRSGVVTARGPGSAFVVASADGVADSVSIEVAATGLSVDRATSLVAGYAGLLRSRDADRIAALAGSVDDTHRNLLTLVREDARDLQVGDPRDVEVVAQEGSRATVRFVLPLRWKGNFGENRDDDAVFQATLTLGDGGWVVSSCRLVEPISY